MTIDGRTRTLPEIEAELTQARADLAAAEEAEQRAYDRVTASREGLALGQLAKRALLLVQRTLASAQEASEQGRAKIRALERIAADERTRLDQEAKRRRADQAAAERRERHAIEDRIGVFLRYVLVEADAIEAEVAGHNRASATLLAPLRGLANYGRWEMAAGAISVLSRDAFPAPKLTSNEKES